MSQTALSQSTPQDSVLESSVLESSALPSSATSESSALREQVAQAVRGLLPKVLGRAVPAVRDDAPLFEEIGLDSATTLELILELEDAIEAQIDVEQISQDDLVTLGALVDFLAGHVVQD